MGQVLKIEDDEAISLARELAMLTGMSIGSLVADALRSKLRTERERRKWVADMMVATDEFAELLDDPRPASDHGWLYDDETGLPA